MDAPVKVACIAATAATIIAAAQITSQWLLALRAEKQSKPNEKPDIQSISRVVFKKFFNAVLIVSSISQLFFIALNLYQFRKPPMLPIEVVLLSFQVSVFVSSLLGSFLLIYQVVSLRFVLTGKLTEQEHAQPERSGDAGIPPA